MSRKRRQLAIDAGEWVYRAPFLERGRWRTRRRHKTSGKVRYITLEATSLTDATQEVLDRAREDKTAHENAQKDPRAKALLDGVTVARALDQWGKTLSARVRPATMSAYLADIELYKRGLGETRSLADVSFADVEDLFFTTWADRKGRTLLKHRTALVRFFRWAVKRGYARRNVVEELEIPVSWRRQTREAKHTTGQAITVEEARRLLAKCREKYVVKMEPSNRKGFDANVSPPTHLWWTVFIALRTGLRLSNIVGSRHKPGLRWGDVDLEDEIVDIPGEFMKNDLRFRVPIHPELAEELRKHAAELAEEGRVPAADSPIVPVRDNVEKSFEAALKRAKLSGRDFRFHDLRHTFLSWLGAHTTHSVMQVLAGHSAASITDRYARHQIIDDLREGLSRLPPLLRRPRKKSSKEAGNGSTIHL